MTTQSGALWSGRTYVINDWAASRQACRQIPSKITKHFFINLADSVWVSRIEQTPHRICHIHSPTLAIIKQHRFDIERRASLSSIIYSSWQFPIARHRPSQVCNVPMCLHKSAFVRQVGHVCCEPPRLNVKQHVIFCIQRHNQANVFVFFFLTFPLIRFTYSMCAIPFYYFIFPFFSVVSL